MSVPKTGVARVGMQRGFTGRPGTNVGRAVPTPEQHSGVDPRWVIHPPPGSEFPTPEVVPRPPWGPPGGSWPNAVTPPWSWNWAQWYRPPWAGGPWWPWWAPADWRTTEDDWRWWSRWWWRGGVPNQTALAQWPLGFPFRPPFMAGWPILCRGCQAGWPFDAEGRHIGPAPYPASNRFDCQRVKWWGMPGASGFPLRWRSGWWQSADFSTGDTAIWVRPWGSGWVPPLPPGPGPGGGGGGGGVVTPAPVITMVANPPSVVSGGSSTITWNATNATSCTASGAWSGPQGTSGTFNTGAVTATEVFTLTCTGPGGPTTQNLTLSVTAPPPPQVVPTITLVASPATIPSGGSSLLTWAATDAAVVTASGGWGGNLTPAAGGSKQSGTLTSTTTFTVVASNSAGDSTPASATVTVQATGTTANYTLVAGGFVGSSGYIVSEIGYIYGSQQAQYRVGSLSPTQLFSTGLNIRDIFSHAAGLQELDVWIDYSASTTQTNLFDYVQLVDDAGATRTFYSNNLGTGNFDTDGSTWQHWYWEMGTNAMAMNTVGKTYHVTFYKA